jgi:hypothetical protein
MNDLGSQWRGQLTLEVVRYDLRLTVVVQPFHKRKTGTVRWAAIAVEAPADAESLAEILASHAHADLGDYDTCVDTVVAAEAYIRGWLSKNDPLLSCPCEPIFTADGALCDDMSKEMSAEDFAKIVDAAEGI